MEPRYRTLLPILAIVFVIAIAFVAFIITRRVRQGNLAASASPALTSTDLLLSDPTPTSNPTKATSKPASGNLRQQPITGDDDATTNVYTTAFDDQGFRDSSIAVSVGTKVQWLNLGVKSQSFTIASLPSGAIAAGSTFAYVFDKPQTITITLAESASSQTIVIR